MSNKYEIIDLGKYKVSFLGKFGYINIVIFKDIWGILFVMFEIIISRILYIVWLIVI